MLFGLGPGVQVRVLRVMRERGLLVRPRRCLVSICIGHQADSAGTDRANKIQNPLYLCGF